MLDNSELWLKALLLIIEGGFQLKKTANLIFLYFFFIILIFLVLFWVNFTFLSDFLFTIWGKFWIFWVLFKCTYFFEYFMRLLVTQKLPWACFWGCPACPSSASWQWGSGPGCGFMRPSLTLVHVRLSYIWQTNGIRAPGHLKLVLQHKIGLGPPSIRHGQHQ